MNFMNNLKTTMDNNNFSVTENGAVGFASSGSQLLDINFSVASLRKKSDDEIKSAFVKAFYENQVLAIKWLFFARDVRGGLGERRVFRLGMQWLSETHPELARTVLPFVPEYGRIDDMWCLLETPLKKDVLKAIKVQLAEDKKAMAMNNPCSLLAKWLPSINTSSAESKHLAKTIIAGIGMSEKEYRKTLSNLRQYLNVVERKMSDGEWAAIDYNTVPSRANLIYRNVFLKHDEQRRRAYLTRLERGDSNVKINSSVNFPHDIVHGYTGGSSYMMETRIDATLEELWKALPDYVNNQENTICVADGSGSMEDAIGNGGISCLDVANALAIYFAEHSDGQFKNKYITFSERPQFVDLSSATSLRDKINIALQYDEVANTNIEAVFDLLLKTAIQNDLSQDELPTNILILSDMEFDRMSCDNNSRYGIRTSLFREIESKWKNAGYQMPRCVFWNLNSRTGTMPVNMHENFPVALVSGFSPTICNMVLSGDLDPYKCLVSQLNVARYAAIEKAITPYFQMLSLEEIQESSYEEDADEYERPYLSR